MQFLGKLFGTVSGWALGGPWGGLFGLALGQAFDGNIKEPKNKDDSATRKISFTIGVIALAAKMAKADGEVTPDEVEAFKQIFHVPQHEMRNVVRVYELAQQDTAGFEVYARQVANMFQDRTVILEDLLDALFHIAKADGVVHPNEMAYLTTVAEQFGFEQAQFDQLVARHLGVDHANPYVIMGLDPEISDADLKIAYRRQVKENHPDRLIANGVPREFAKIATDRLAAINEAYERIKTQRGLS